MRDPDRTDPGPPEGARSGRGEAELIAATINHINHCFLVTSNTALTCSSLQQSARRQGTLAFSLFGVLLAHGDLRINKLSQLAVNLWNLSHKHGYCETRISVSSHTYTHTHTGL